MTKHFPLAVGQWTVEHLSEQLQLDGDHGDVIGYPQVSLDVPLLTIEIKCDDGLYQDGHIPIVVLKHWIAEYERLNGVVR